MLYVCVLVCECMQTLCDRVYVCIDIKNLCRDVLGLSVVAVGEETLY